MLITIFVCLYMFFKHNHFKFNIRVFIVALLILTAAIPVIISKLSSVLGSMDMENGSTYARVEAIQYYLSTIKGNFLFGYGLIIPDHGEPNYYLIKGPYGIYNYDDIGIIGVFASMGIVGVIIYLSLVIYCFSLAYRSRINRVLKMGLCLVLVMNLPLMSFFDKSRITSLLFLLVFLEMNTSQKGENNVFSYFNRL